jgi:hypothetical protein
MDAERRARKADEDVPRRAALERDERRVKDLAHVAALVDRGFPAVGSDLDALARGEAGVARFLAWVRLRYGIRWWETTVSNEAIAEAHVRERIVAARSEGE